MSLIDYYFRNRKQKRNDQENICDLINWIHFQFHIDQVGSQFIFDAISTNNIIDTTKQFY